MTRNFDRDLTIMVAGSGNVTLSHLQQSLGEWMFPTPETEREVHIVLPLFAQMGSGIRNLIKTGLEWGCTFTVIQAKDAPMTRELSSLPEESFVRQDTERQALDWGIQLLSNRAEAGDEIAFIMAYNPNNTYEQGNNTLSDFEILGDVKMYPEITTLNLCEGLIDSFEGYKSPQEIAIEAGAKAKFALEQAAKEDAKPKEEKAPAPRRRAPRKAVTPKVTKSVEEPEKALEDVPVGTVVEVAGLEFTKVGPNPFREPLPKDAVLSANVVLPKTKEVWDDVAEAQLQNKIKDHMVYVKKSDLSDLSEGIKELTQSFGKIMDTFTRILKED